LSPLIVHAVLGAGRGPLGALFYFNLVTSLGWLAIIFGLIRRPFLFHALAAPLYLLTAVDLFLIFEFRSRLSAGYMMLALTDHGETSDFLASYAKPVALTALVLAIVYIPSVFALRGVRFHRHPRLVLGAAGLLVGAYGYALNHNVVRDRMEVKQALLDIVGKEMGSPVGLFAQAGLTLHLNADGHALMAQRAQYVFTATKAPTAQREIHVLVIGESSRPQNWSLFGYERETTPKLRAMPGVVPLPNMLTTAPQTSIAVPSMLSLAPITDWRAILSQSSILKAFEGAGFRTHWISAQEMDSWGGYIPQIAAEAQRRRFFERVYDGALLPEFRSVIAGIADGEKHLIVLHTKGSHFQFARRYPPEFARFKSDQPSARNSLIDTYDNSILYTDWFLSEVIGELNRSGAASALVYASDHGENLLDDQRQLFGHAIGNRYDLSTAAFVWLSDAMRQQAPEAAAAATGNAGQPLSLSSVPHSMLDLAGIEARGLDRSQSIFSPTFTARTRWHNVRGTVVPETSEQAGGSGR
jgi:heptose-I-phosphate ethanolaminephosphotransferase